MTTTLDGYTAGDTITLRLTVRTVDGGPADQTTSARVEVLGPEDEPVTTAAYPTDGSRGTWTATLGDVEPGEYMVRWVVTGTGAGTESVRVMVAPFGRPAGRSYATTAQLAEHMQSAPPEGSRLLLVRATARVDELLHTAVYDHAGPDEYPTDPRVAAAFAEAVCAQAAWMYETGDETGTGAAGRWASVRIGSVQLASGQSESERSRAAGQRYGAGVVAALRSVPGLFPIGPGTL